MRQIENLLSCLIKQKQNKFGLYFNEKGNSERGMRISFYTYHLNDDNYVSFLLLDKCLTVITDGRHKEITQFITFY